MPSISEQFPTPKRATSKDFDRPPLTDEEARALIEQIHQINRRCRNEEITEYERVRLHNLLVPGIGPLENGAYSEYKPREKEEEEEEEDDDSNPLE